MFKGNVDVTQALPHTPILHIKDRLSRLSTISPMSTIMHTQILIRTILIYPQVSWTNFCAYSFCASGLPFFFFFFLPFAACSSPSSALLSSDEAAPCLLLSSLIAFL